MIWTSMKTNSYQASVQRGVQALIVANLIIRPTSPRDDVDGTAEEPNLLRFEKSVIHGRGQDEQLDFTSQGLQSAFELNSTSSRSPVRR